MSFTVYRSSAGSGKTFTLVKEYLKIALTDTQDPPKQFRRILAITFTNKAASEMKDRIIRALKDLSAADHTKIPAGSAMLLNILMNETSFSPDVLRERAASVLKAILHNYSDFAIGTIDSFVHKVVRSFAFDLKLPVNFEIELDAKKLLGEAVQILISKIGEDEQLTNILVEFAEAKAEEEKSWHIEKDLNDLAQELLKEEGALHIAKLRELSIPDFITIRKKMQEAILVFEKNLSAKGEEAVKLIRSRQLDHNVFFYKGSGIYKYFENIALLKKKHDFDPNSYVIKTIEENKWPSGEASSSDIASIDAIKVRLTELYHSIQESKEKGISRYRLFQMLSKKMYSLAVLNEIEKILEDYKKENAILHISEFNKLIAEIVFEEPVPFIYERLGERYSNYLIDEFQDTSVLQWQNLLPLVDNALSEEQFTMLVGDGKQAIYRWRGGDVAQFADLPAIRGFDDNPVILERESSLKRHYKPQFLGSNYRSKMEIIDFNNSLYRKLSESLPDEHRRIYDKLEQNGNPKNTGGGISIEFFSGEKSDQQEAHRQRVSELAANLLTEGYHYGDMAILTRTNLEGNEMATFLIQKGIPVLSNDSLLLSHSYTVNFLAAVFRLLYNANDDVAKAEIILFLSNKEASSQLERDLLQSGNNSAFHHWLEEKNIDFRPRQLLKLPLYQMSEELLRIFHLDKKPDPYLIFFLDEILSFSNGRDSSLAGWVQHWEIRKEKASAIVPNGIDAVNILTVHRAKGLEYPVVILPLADSVVKPGKNTFWLDLDEEIIPEFKTGIVENTKVLEQTRYAPLFSEEQFRTQLDNLNILYVATTRPEERLYLLCGNLKTDAKSSGDFSSMLNWYCGQMNLLPDGHGRIILAEGTSRLGKTEKKEPGKESTFLNTFISTDWQNKIRIRSASREVWSDEQQKKQDTGLVIHTILSRIKTHADLESALFSVYEEGLIDSDELPEIRVLLDRVLNHPTLLPFFAEGLKVKNEAEILLADGTSFRPDRIVYTPSKTVIIDYKTGKETSSHHDQVENYALILSDMGERVIEKYLVYTDEMRVVQV
jgi:ATP-dependent exoDNAse (exonuclease V) beta subunit